MTEKKMASTSSSFVPSDSYVWSDSDNGGDGYSSDQEQSSSSGPPKRKKAALLPFQDQVEPRMDKEAPVYCEKCR